MLWKGRRQSGNVEDRRGRSPRRAVAGGGALVLVIGVVLALLNGGDLSSIFSDLTSGGEGGGRSAAVTAEEQELADFVSVVLADTEDVWHQVFRESERTYREPRLVFYRDSVQTGGGVADASIGPFYMSADETIYIDLAFLADMGKKLGARGDFAQAYVIAHEVGHHVQHLLGTLGKVHQQEQQANEKEANRLSVRLELQADFYAGLWAARAQRMKNFLEQGDLEEALGAASAIGDDRLQKRARGYVVPDSFTHGTSAQRAAWFRHGLESNRIADGDTFDDALFRRVSGR